MNVNKIDVNGTLADIEDSDARQSVETLARNIYTKDETDERLNGKADTIHEHQLEDVEGLSYELGILSTAIGSKQTAYPLGFNGSRITHNGSILTFAEIKAKCLDDTYFVYLAYDKRLYIPAYIEDELITFVYTSANESNGIVDKISVRNTEAVTFTQYSLAKMSDIPNKTSQLTNDSGFTTKAYVDGLANGKADKPTEVTSGTDITLADNTEYRLTDVSTLNVTYPTGNFEVWMRIAVASEGAVTITLPTSQYIGDAPTFANGEVWELSIKDAVVIANKVTV